jgi:hypothetical protein
MPLMPVGCSLAIAVDPCIIERNVRAASRYQFRTGNGGEDRSRASFVFSRVSQSLGVESLRQPRDIDVGEKVRISVFTASGRSSISAAMKLQRHMWLPLSSELRKIRKYWRRLSLGSGDPADMTSSSAAVTCQ